jgi:hypothetical protein
VTDPVFLTQNLAELWLAAPGFEDLLLLGENTDADGFTYTIKAMANGAAWGVPAAVDVEVQRWMTDGAVATTQGHNNRTITFQVVVSAATTLDLAMGEAALVRRASGPAQLRWTSPEGDGLAPTTVLEVWTWHLEHALDIDTELRLARGYTVTMTAKPWARSFDLSEVDALVTVASPVITSIDPCTSLTGWTGSPNAPTQSAGAVHETDPVTAPASASSSSYVVSLDQDWRRVRHAHHPLPAGRRDHGRRLGHPLGHRRRGPAHSCGVSGLVVVVADAGRGRLLHHAGAVGHGLHHAA